uniref:Uncharacterized protein n=1 Tax=Nelumbo nucifera TaxID=4432 RepID=A0A822ZQX6_NELNU|nr:TPA_asm: hypothetical protein HUJ06_002448 [Nelumbo nucifera]
MPPPLLDPLTKGKQEISFGYPPNVSVCNKDVLKLKDLHSRSLWIVRIGIVGDSHIVI